jgi:hypothetical protein
MVKIAAGVMVLAAVLVGLNVIDTGGGVVWGNVLQNVNESAAFAYRMKLTMLGVPDPQSTTEIESQVRVDTEVGIHIVSSMKGAPYSESFVSIPKETGVTLLPARKAYLRQKMTGGMLEKMGTQHGDPRQLVARFMEYSHTELGRRTLEGVEVEGLECRDPRVAAGVFGGWRARLLRTSWGSVGRPRTNLPVRLEIEAFSADGRKAAEMGAIRIRLGARIDPAEFEPVIRLTTSWSPTWRCRSMKSLVEGLEVLLPSTRMGNIRPSCPRWSWGRELGG